LAWTLAPSAASSSALARHRMLRTQATHKGGRVGLAQRCKL
jgi:hypothetical protein